jgi:LPS O-antigen subunit length determinant protein (WzzB/FepE family)
MKWIGQILVFLVVLIGVAFAIGYALPARTTHTRTITIKRAPEAVFALLADVPGMPKWNVTWRRWKCFRR